MIKETPTTNKGFVILFSILISTIVLMIGISILGISVKETILSAAARESNKALAAADAAIECALLLDIANVPSLLDPAQQNQTCNGLSLSNSFSGNLSSLRFNYPMDTVNQQEGCALVYVTRQPDPNLNGATVTTIQARGFNLCDANNPPMPLNDPSLVERVYKVTYIRQ